jgi:uncharacterized protein (TIGR03000 family)
VGVRTGGVHVSGFRPHVARFHPGVARFRTGFARFHPGFARGRVLARPGLGTRAFRSGRVFPSRPWYGYGYASGYPYFLYSSPYAYGYPYGSYPDTSYVPYGLNSTTVYSPTTVETTPEEDLTTEAMPPDESEQQQAQQQEEADNAAHLQFIVPENAEIFVEGVKTNLTGTQREFVSPPLTPGKSYVYSVRVRSRNDNGQVVDETRSVRVRAGDRWRVDFTKPAREMRSGER